MDHVLAEYGLRLTYLRDANVIEGLDQDRILEELSDDTPGGDPLPWLTRYPLVEYDHLVLATDQSTGRYLGVLGIHDGATSSERFIRLGTAFITPAARGQKLTRRMIALAILRIGTFDTVPSAIAMCTRDPVYYRILQSIARCFNGGSFFPEPASATINFRTATLAQRIARAIYPNSRFQTMTGTIRGSMPAVFPPHYCRLSNDPQIDRLFGQHMQSADRMLAVVDLRGSDEGTIFNDARRIYRSKLTPSGPVPSSRQEARL